MNILDSLKNYFYKNGSSEASSDARIPLLTATGEPKGSDTMANIASVLGGVRIELNSTSDLNNCKDPAVYFWSASVTTPQNAPMNVGSTVQVIPRANKQDQITQICYTYTNKIFLRTYMPSASSWSQWAEISSDMPTFYKNYADLSSLATALGGLTNFNVNGEQIVTQGDFSRIPKSFPNKQGIYVGICTENTKGFYIAFNYGQGIVNDMPRYSVGLVVLWPNQLKIFNTSDGEFEISKV